MVAKYLNIASLGTPRGAPRIPESEPQKLRPRQRACGVRNRSTLKILLLLMEVDSATTRFIPGRFS
jgi:hypothetical protein